MGGGSQGWIFLKGISGKYSTFLEIRILFFLGGGGFFREEKSASVFMYVIKILLLENKQTV